MEEELARLTRLRATIRGQLTRLQQTLKQLQDPTDYEVSTRLTNLNNYEQKFEKLQNDIELRTSNLEAEMEQRHTTEEHILELKVMLHGLRPTPPTTPSTYVTASPEITPKINFQPMQAQENFNNFVQRFKTYMKLNNCYNSETQTLSLLSLLPPELHQKAYDLCAPNDPCELKFDSLVLILQNYIDPKPSIWARQHKFISRLQGSEETVTSYSSELKHLAQDCEFTCNNCKKSICDNFLTLQFIRGLNDTDIRTKILQETIMTDFADIINKATAIELAKSDSSYMSLAHTSNQGLHVKTVQADTKPRRQKQENLRPLSIKDLRGRCFRCGSKEHRADKCRSVKDTCSKCKRIGHLARVCLQSTPENNQLEPEHAEVQDEDHSTDTIDDTPWDMNLVRSNNTDKFMINVRINNTKLKMEVDTGAALSSISYKDFKTLNSGCKIYKTNITMRTYTGEIFAPLGVAYVTCKYNDQTFEGKLYIIKQNVDPIFGRAWIRAINLDLANINVVTTKEHPELDKLLAEFSKVFDGTLGCIPDYKAHLTLKEDISPIFIKPRRIPYALKKKVDDEIDRLCEQGVITKVDSSEWGTPVVPIVKPNGSIRLCADYKVTLNNAMKDEQYPIPIIEDILVEMNGGRVFCTLDISQAYLNMMMDEESAMMQTLSTHKGTFKVNRLMFGVKVAPNLWQKYMDRLLQGVPGVKCFFDDIIIQGRSEEQLLTRLRLILQKIQASNLRLNKEKCIFFQESIEYLGLTIDKYGLHKNRNKVKAILDAKCPKNINELRTFLGMANYYNKFIPNLASLSSPLNNLLKKDIKYEWTHKCNESFKKIKREIVSDRVLIHFDPEKPLVLATDASPFGLGAVLSHRFLDGSDRPIAFASRSLTSSEQKYSQIDKEATSLFWGLKKFFHYCYGRKFILITDHKPLTSIFHPHKTLPAMSTMRLFHYAHFLSGFDYTIEYRTSNDHSNADYLSRFPVDIVANNIIDVHTAFHLNQMNTIAVNPIKIAEKSRCDNEYYNLLEALKNGTSVRKYGYNDNELTIQDGCIIKGTRVMIPADLRPQVLEELHTGHLGIVKMKLLARGYVYWRHMDKDIEDIVKGCRECRLKQNQPACAVLHHWDLPSGPWQRIHIDFAGPIKGYSLFIIVDAFTKWVEIIETKTTTSAWCVRQLKELFVTFGFPLTLVSDNGRQFVSNEFESFLKESGVIHKTTAPYHPATNGQAERYVQTIKKAIHSINVEPGSLQDKLLGIKERLRRTPSSSTNKSPYELMFGREIRNTLSVIFKARTREETRPPTDEASVRTFSVGQRVQIRSYTDARIKWEFGTILRTLGQLHYEIETDSGQICKRHVDQMLVTLIPREGQ